MIPGRRGAFALLACVGQPGSLMTSFAFDGRVETYHSGVRCGNWTRMGVFMIAPGGLRRDSAVDRTVRQKSSALSICMEMEQ